MLRVRAKSGKTIVVEEPLQYVEILDGSGNVAMVFYRDDFAGEQAVSFITPDIKDDAIGYSKMYGVTWSEEIKGNWPKPQQVEVNAR